MIRIMVNIVNHWRCRHCDDVPHQFHHHLERAFLPAHLATRTDVKPLTLGLVELTTGGTGAGRPGTWMSALAMVMIVPAVLLVTIFQRVFVRGLTQGAVK